MSYHSRGHYWANGKIADWVRTIFKSPKKLTHGTSEEWDAWTKTSKAHHPVAYWFTDSFLDTLQNLVNWPVDKIDDIRCYCRNRFVTKTHYARTGLKPGQWHETDERILYAPFGLLVDFIEVEKAHMMLWSYPELGRPWWRKFRLTNWGEFRSRDLGMKHLDWEMSLTHGEGSGTECGDEMFGLPTGQAESAYEQRLLYMWWKDTRPTRPDPHDASGYAAYFEHMHKKAEADGEDGFRSLFGGKHTVEEIEMQKAASTRCQEIEDQYEKEDTAMLVRLINVRHHLWT